ncbi:TetR/AcrR family transcriptional regulator [Actinoalloteichus sp. GBA129-24]|uniref:TetR/AcrR family transcriptional regulator n=1 Tax=Actinoalloteichus sp. GBA129-24 TaxID=1612551 RepID=UPI000950806D|nr:TetR/AcrR family transcriptional regulator C-terminal domain-containing protein [Actinoalloteichus sp. GBA129-24]APU21420.1 transcriptional regulator, TetR family [Actinoalloteichus sp. GBA129-24]
MPAVGLDREAVVGAALDIAAEGGFAAMSMRVLAERLSVTPMAIYRYVENRESLNRIVADEAGKLIRPRLDPAAPWHRNAREWARAQRSGLRRFPGLAAWLTANGPAGEQAYRLLDDLASSMLKAGFDDEATARACAMIMSWVFSRVSVEDAADARARQAVPSRARAFVSGLSSLDTARYPAASRIGSRFFTLSMDTIFESGLDAVLAGCLRRAEEAAETPENGSAPAEHR